MGKPKTKAKKIRNLKRQITPYTKPEKVRRLELRIQTLENNGER